MAAENDTRTAAGVQRAGKVQSVTVTNATGSTRTNEYVQIDVGAGASDFWAGYVSQDHLRVRDDQGEDLPYYISTFTPSTAATMGCGQARMALTTSPVISVKRSMTRAMLSNVQVNFSRGGISDWPNPGRSGATI